MNPIRPTKTPYEPSEFTARRSSVAHLTDYSMHYSRGSTECDRCTRVVADRSMLWHFGTRAEVCSMCRDEIIAGEHGALALEYLSACERMPRDAGNHGPIPTSVLDLRPYGPGWSAS